MTLKFNSWLKFLHIHSTSLNLAFTSHKIRTNYCSVTTEPPPSSFSITATLVILCSFAKY